MVSLSLCDYEVKCCLQVDLLCLTCAYWLVNHWHSLIGGPSAYSVAPNVEPKTMALAPDCVFGRRSVVNGGLSHWTGKYLPNILHYLRKVLLHALSLRCYGSSLWCVKVRDWMNAFYGCSNEVDILLLKWRRGRRVKNSSRLFIYIHQCLHRSMLAPLLRTFLNTHVGHGQRLQVQAIICSRIRPVGAYVRTLKEAKPVYLLYTYHTTLPHCWPHPTVHLNWTSIGSGADDRLCPSIT